MLPCRRLPPVCLWVWDLSFACAVSLQAQGSVAAPPTALKLDYPDSAAGLEHLVKDIIKAQKENAGDRADALLQSLVLPQPRDWYDMALGTSVAEECKAIYEQSGASIPNSMAQFLLHAVSNGMNDVVVVRFEKSCDDNSGEDVFGILEARRQPMPLYELRLIKGQPSFVYSRLLLWTAASASSTLANCTVTCSGLQRPARLPLLPRQILESVRPQKNA